MLHKVHILHIEDDAREIRILEWLVDQVDHVQLTTCLSFNGIAPIIKANTIDLIITNTKIHNDHYSDYLAHFSHVDYIVLSNTTDAVKNHTLYPPLKSLTKPLSLDVFKSLFEVSVPKQTTPKDDYFDNFPEKEQRQRLIFLLKREFENVLNTVPNLLKNNSKEEIRFIVHKVSGKFSILQMKDSFELARTIEKELMKDILSKDKIQSLLKNTQTAFTYLTINH